LNTPHSITGQYLKNHNRRIITSRKRTPDKWLVVKAPVNITLKTSRYRFLSNPDLRYGVSGAGKSTLLKKIILHGLKHHLLEGKEHKPVSADLSGWEHLDRVLDVDHSPIGRTPRSTPATYVGFYDDIRRLFSLIPDARMRGYNPGRFSLNIKGGRCEGCGGQGKKKIEMSFLPDVYVDCEVCGGRGLTAKRCTLITKAKTYPRCST
jgi:excinuclease ABC subunit A